MHPRVARLLNAGATAAVMLALPATLAGQAWNSPAALALARQGAARRAEAAADSSLQSYRTQAHGFVFFLAQVGEEGMREPPRLVKADELQVEVYWHAPNLSKQVIQGWRDGRFLPTDIDYHRDHLGIVTNNFGDLIRIGEGDEVRDVPHPLSAAGLELYDFALTDSVTVQGAGGSIRLLALSVRPRDFGQPRVVGTLFLDASTSQLVRFRFSFTPAAYLDSQLEDISITLESALWEGRYWLPHRQEIEIRRRFSWLEFPARGIIRGRWEIEDYDLNAPFPAELLNRASISGLRRPDNSDSTRWQEPLVDAIHGLGQPFSEAEMAGIRADVERVAGSHLLSGLPASRIGGQSVSDLVRVNRVQGLALGASGVIGVGRNRIQFRPSLGIGTSDGRATGGLAVTIGQGATQLSLAAQRSVDDVGGTPVIAPLLNSIMAQEFGKDYGDYFRLDRADLAVRQRFGPRHSATLSGGIEHAYSLEVTHEPASGTYRPNPSLGAGEYRVGRLELARAPLSTLATARDLDGALVLEAGDGATDYVRASASVRLRQRLGNTELLLTGAGGWGSARLPAYRDFVMGGRGSLVGEPFRAYGGRSLALGRLEWRVDVPAPAIPLGSFASTGHSITLAPFLAAGWSGGGQAGVPWTSSDGIRPVAGIAIDLFMRLLRVEGGVALRTGDVGLTVDVNRDWWGIL
ncbi:MAG TPA: hypothetical protein VFL88_05365 [Gemmatimonadales bacterium]|jgi:hypothetical protein|nr:hypothetical protein [Gemmatimonadales bacterium]